MKFRVTMKSPDCLEDSISGAINDSSLDWDLISKEHTEFDELRESEIHTKIEETKELCKKWFKYGEYITVEIDTEAKTCVVVPV
jgi:ABC-type amino acid transport substrate-binding protein